jgi:hypothetical protein
MDARNVPVDNSYKLIFCSIEISKNYYSLFLGCGLLYFAVAVCLSMIPVVGEVIEGVLSLCLSLGTLRLVKQIFTTGKGTFDDFLKYSFDASYFEKFLPLFIIVATVNFFSWLISYVHAPFIVYPWTLLTLVSLFVCSHAAYMMILAPELSWKNALTSVLRGTWMNAATLFLLLVFMIVFVSGSLLMCLVGFFLYFIPMTVPVNYLVFSSIYEGLDVEATTKEWSIKSNTVQTVSTPADEP